jgi:hypothetical protein
VLSRASLSARQVSPLKILPIRALILALPVIFLAADYLYFPILFLTQTSADSVVLNDLLTEKVYPLGSFRGHRILASIDDIQDPEYLHSLPSNPNILIFSAYVQSERDGRTKVTGALQNAVLFKLMNESRTDYLKLKQKFDSLPELTKPIVFSLKLSIPKSNFSHFPVQELVVIAFSKGRLDAADIRDGLEGATKLAAQSGTNIVIPLIGTRWDEHSSLPPADFFEALFKSLPLAIGPSSIYLSLYSRWPTFELEDAAAALNAVWQEIGQASQTSYNIYRLDFRALLCFLEVCLLVCAWKVPLTLKNGAIIIFGYFGAAVGSKGLIDAVAPGETRFALWLKLGVFLFIALLFPLIVTLSPKDLFGTKSGSRSEET